MAEFLPFFKKLMVHEGGWSNDAADKGGPTKYGVILKEWIAKGWDKDGDNDVDVNDLKLITLEDAARIAKPYYWDKVGGDTIRNQSFAEMLADFAYNSGVGTASKKLQKLLGLKEDGVIGPVTIAKVNSVNQEDLFNKFKQIRINFYLAIVNSNPSQKVFLKGWMNRINSFTFQK
jgi:lysozyme family protein